MEHERFGWAEFGDAVNLLARKVIDDRGFEPDSVLAIARGGLVVAGPMAYALGLKNCFSVNVEYYEGVDQRRELPVELAPALDPTDLAGMNVLVCDDVNDTGHTLRLVLDKIGGQVARVRSLVLYEKPHSEIRADYVWRTTDRWIDFPWSVDTPLRGVRQRSRSADLGLAPGPGGIA